LKYILYKLTNLLVIFSLCLAATPVYAHPVAQDTATNDYTYGECSKTDKNALRSEIEKIAHQVLTDQSNGIDIQKVVARQWTTLNVDAVINSEVERAVNKLGDQEGYFSRLWSGWSAEKAEQFATQISTDAFSSPTFKNKINELSTAIADEISKAIEANFARAASAAFLCMKAYVGERYSTTLFSAFEDKVSVEVKRVDVAAANPIAVNAIDVHDKALGGLGLIIVTEISRRIAQNLAEKITERIAGGIIERILGEAGASLIPIAGWVVGLGLIAWDLWQGGKGALPQIQEALESEDVKAKIRNEITASVRDSLPQEVSIVSLEIAVNLIDDWNNFCTRYQYVCLVADENTTFKKILNDTALNQMDALSNLVNAFIESAGRSALNKAIENGQFEVLLQLPPAAVDILHTTKSVDTTLSWAQLAGDQLDKVAQYGIYKQKTPSDFEQKSLTAVLNLGDSHAITNVLALDHDQLLTVVDFAGKKLLPIAQRTPPNDLKQLADYLVQKPDQVKSAELANALASGATTVQKLINPEPTLAPLSTPVAQMARPSLGANLVMAGQRLYALAQPVLENRIAVASLGLFILVLLAVLISLILHRRHGRMV